MSGAFVCRRRARSLTGTSRRAFIGIAAAAPLAAAGLGAAPAYAATASDDTYPSNTALYQDSTLVEGTDYIRRYYRHAVTDDLAGTNVAFAKTTVLALHGGGIEAGTSELCLATCGFPPGSEAPAEGEPTYDYWMFEGVRTSNNTALHVTATHCDDGVALLLCAGSMNTLSLHGCSPADAGLAAGTAAVLVGGLNSSFKQYLIEALTIAGFQTKDAASIPALAGVEPANIANRNLLGAGCQLEITKPLRDAMFSASDNTVAGRGNNTNGVFWDFVRAPRTAIARAEADLTIL